MTAFTFADRLWRTVAQRVDKPLLRLVASQRVLRVLFEVSAQLGSALPRAATMTRDAQRGLTVRPHRVARDAPKIFYIHGGGFTIGSPRTHAALAGHLAAAMGVQAYLPRYRRAPDHPFPTARDDVIAAYERVCAAGPAPVAICGDSAGGCLSLQLAQAIRDRGLPAPAALGLIAPIADLSGDIEAAFANAPGEMLIPKEWAERIKAAYLPGVDRAAPEVSPLRGDLTGLPPTLIQAGAEEALVKDAERLVDAMDAATLSLWPGLPHVWHIHAGRAASANRALAELAEFLNGHRG